MLPADAHAVKTYAYLDHPPYYALPDAERRVLRNRLLKYFIPASVLMSVVLAG